MKETQRKINMDDFIKDPKAEVVFAMGYQDPRGCLEEIFKNGLEEAHWIARIKAPITSEYNNTIDDILDSLFVDKLEIEDTDGVIHKVTDWNATEAFYKIAERPEYHWIVEDLVNKKGPSKKRAANLFIQFMIFETPVYFG